MNSVILQGTLEEEVAQLQRFLSPHGMRVEAAETVEVYGGARVREFIIVKGDQQGKLCWGVRDVSPETRDFTVEEGFEVYIYSPSTSFGNEPPFDYNERCLYFKNGILYQEGLTHNVKIL